MVTAQGTPPCTYTVQSGDTLFDIAQAYYGDGSQYQKIVDANKDQNVTPSTLMAGTTISIPASASGNGLQTPPNGPAATVTQGAAPTTHTVAAGDSLYGIAEAYYGDCRLWRTISAANGGVHPGSLTPGQQLQIPVQPVQGPAPGSVAYPTTSHW